MKPILQAVLILGLVMPAFSAEIAVDFDEVSKKSLDIMQELKTNSEKMIFKAQPKRDFEIKFFRVTESGQGIEVFPEEISDGKNYYKFKPNEEFYWNATCSAQSGVWHVCLKHTFYPNYGGHNHDTNIPPYYSPDGTPMANPYCLYNLPVGQEIRAYFKGPQFATRSEEVNSVWGTCGGDYYHTMDFKIDNLALLPPAWADSLHGGVTYYNLIGETSQHPINHFGRPQTIDLIKEIAWQYRTEFPNAEVLNVNDISLKWGGLFDISGEWAMPHEFHRYGRQADFRLSSIPAGNQARFKQISCDLGVKVELHSKDHKKLEPIEASAWEGMDFNTPPWKFLSAEELDMRVPHYHLVFPKYDSEVDTPADQAPQGCPSKSPHR